MHNETVVAESLNADPITAEHGSQPVGTTLRAPGGAVAGAVVGSVEGARARIGMGAVIAAVAGGPTGHGVGEAVNPTHENNYWEKNFRTRKYAETARPYSDYQDAYRYGWESRAANPARKWAEVEAELARGWERGKGKSALTWELARAAAMDSWNRVEMGLRGNSEIDGR